MPAVTIIRAFKCYDKSFSYYLHFAYTFLRKFLLANILCIYSSTAIQFGKDKDVCSDKEVSLKAFRYLLY